MPIHAFHSATRALGMLHSNTRPFHSAAVATQRPRASSTAAAPGAGGVDNKQVLDFIDGIFDDDDGEESEDEFPSAHTQAHLPPKKRKLGTSPPPHTFDPPVVSSSDCALSAPQQQQLNAPYEDEDDADFGSCFLFQRDGDENGLDRRCAAKTRASRGPAESPPFSRKKRPFFVLSFAFFSFSLFLSLSLSLSISLSVER